MCFQSSHLLHSYSYSVSYSYLFGNKISMNLIVDILLLVGFIIHFVLILSLIIEKKGN